jgi:hypothetical protein
LCANKVVSKRSWRSWSKSRSKKIQIYVNVFSFNFFVFARFSVFVRFIRVDSFFIIIIRILRTSTKKRINIVIVSKIDEFSRDARDVMNDDDDKESNVNDDNRSNCIQYCRISIDCRRIASIVCDKCFKQKMRVFGYVLNSCIDVFLFNSSQISIRFRIVVYQLSDVRIVLRVDEISTKTFMKKRAILQFFLIVWNRERNDWENTDEIDKKTIRIHEKKLFFIRNIANSLRTFVKRKILEMHDLNLNFEKK